MYEDEIPVGRAENLIGQKFGRWTVLYRTYDKRNTSYWMCECECKTRRAISKTHLKSGHSQSCGCFHKDKMTASHILDISGQRFGILTAIKPTNKKLSTSVIWECKCDCGNICYCSVSHLKSGNNKSCGCVLSIGEKLTASLLMDLKIDYIRQATFESCRFSDTNKMAKFDFFLCKLGYIIEIDGKQHYEPVEFFGGEERFHIQIKHDTYKNQWCRENGIPLIRIPYWKLDTLCIEDLMLETTKFRVV